MLKELFVTFLVSFGKHHLRIWVIGVLPIFLRGCVPKSQDIPIIENATINLSGWEYSQQPKISVEGEVCFIRSNVLLMQMEPIVFC